VKIAVVGAAGKMGSWFCRLLHSCNYDLLLIGRRREPLEALAGELRGSVVAAPGDVRGADATLISVAFDQVENAMRDVSPYVRIAQPVIDISSLKVRPQRLAEQHLACSTYLGVHPMFGPGAESLQGHNVILAPVGGDAARLANEVGSWCSGRGAIVRTMDPEGHDQLMSIVLGLPAFTVAAVARTILKTSKLREAREMSGTSLQVLLALTESMMCQGSELYSMLLEALPDAPALAEAMGRSISHYGELIAARDREALRAEFTQLGNGLTAADRAAEDAYEHMYAMLEALKKYPSR
jgi:prephenate dehydrogenase